MKVIAELISQDYLEANTEDASHLKVVGCQEVLQLIRQFQASYGRDLSVWPLPTGEAHSEMLLRELLLKRMGKWEFPYQHVELCHCRAVTAEKVDQMIVAGAQTPAQVSRLTMASTACGTCRPDVEKIIQYRRASSL